MLSKILHQEINAELAATFIFILLSGSYLIFKHGFSSLVDTLFLWMFPASVMFFLTLLIVKVIETVNNRRVNRQHYVDWRKKN